MFFPNTLQTARETQKHEFHLCLNRRRRRDGRWARLEDQPEHSAGVRPTEGNIPAHLSHRPERTAQHLLLLQPWSTAAHEPGVPRPSDLLTSSGTRSPVRRSPFFKLLPLRVALDAGRETSIICGVRSFCIFAQTRIVDVWGHAPNGLDQCPNDRKAPKTIIALTRHRQVGRERAMPS